MKTYDEAEAETPAKVFDLYIEADRLQAKVYDLRSQAGVVFAEHMARVRPGISCETCRHADGGRDLGWAPPCCGCKRPGFSEWVAKP